MTTPHQGIPATIETLLGQGAYTVDGPSNPNGWGQRITHDLAEFVIAGPGQGLASVGTDIVDFVEGLAHFLRTLPLEALQWMRRFIPGALLEVWDTVEHAVERIMHFIQVNLLMGANEFEKWLSEAYNFLEKEVHQIFDLIDGLIITPISSRVAGFLDWLGAVTGKTAFLTLAGEFDAAKLTNIANIPSLVISNITSLSGFLTNLGATGLYDAAVGFANKATSILKNLDTLGNFDSGFLNGNLAANILVQIINAIIALVPHTALGLTGLTGLNSIFTDLVNHVGIQSALGSGSPVVGTIGVATPPVLAPVVDIAQGIADGAGKAVQGTTGFVQTVVTDATTAVAAVETQIQRAIHTIVPHFW